MNRFLFVLLFLVSSCTNDDDSTLPKEGDYTLTITHVTRNPAVARPNSPIPNDQYQATNEEENLRLRFSKKGEEVTILPRKISGSLESADDQGRIYRLSEGLFAGGELAIEETPEGLIATFTEFGSGVPVISSFRGHLSRAK